MTRMTGIILIVIGLLISITGIWILTKSVKNEIVNTHQNDVVNLSDSVHIINTIEPVNIDESEVNKKAGFDFEKYVVLKFNKEYFTIKNWAGDKYVEGRYAETSTQPDLQLELKLRGKTHPLAVECKWRSKPDSDFIQFANDRQLQHYQAFEEENKIPTFIVLGVGGTPSSPELVYVIPVKRFSKPVQHMDNLKSYQRSSENKFYFDAEKKLLK